jgi:hypothetical protein
LRWKIKVQTKRTTIYFDKDIHSALRLKAAVTDVSISKLVNEIIRDRLAEDKNDLDAFQERANEPVISYESLLQELRANGKL